MNFIDLMIGQRVEIISDRIVRLKGEQGKITAKSKSTNKYCVPINKFPYWFSEDELRKLDSYPAESPNKPAVLYKPGMEIKHTKTGEIHAIKSVLKEYSFDGSSIVDIYYLCYIDGNKTQIFKQDELSGDIIGSKKYRTKNNIIEAYGTTIFSKTITSNGTQVTVAPEDYIIIDSNGKKYPCHKDIFEKIFEEVKDREENIIKEPVKNIEEKIEIEKQNGTVSIIFKGFKHIVGEKIKTKSGDFKVIDVKIKLSDNIILGSSLAQKIDKDFILYSVIDETGLVKTISEKDIIGPDAGTPKELSTEMQEIAEDMRKDEINYKKEVERVKKEECEKTNQIKDEGLREMAEDINTFENKFRKETGMDIDVVSDTLDKNKITVSWKQPDMALFSKPIPVEPVK